MSNPNKQLQKQLECAISKKISSNPKTEGGHLTYQNLDLSSDDVNTLEDVETEVTEL